MIREPHNISRGNVVNFGGYSLMSRGKSSIVFLFCWMNNCLIWWTGVLSRVFTEEGWMRMKGFPLNADNVVLCCYFRSGGLSWWSLLPWMLHTGSAKLLQTGTEQVITWAVGFCTAALRTQEAAVPNGGRLHPVLFKTLLLFIRCHRGHRSTVLLQFLQFDSSWQTHRW